MASDSSRSPASQSSRSSPLFIYKPPTVLSLVRSAVINMFLPFVNGVMLGFGEIFAHEVAFRLGWRGAKLTPARRMVGPGIDMVGPEAGVNEAETRKAWTRSERRQLDALTQLE